MFKDLDEPESPNEGVGLRCMLKRNRQLRVNIFVGSQTPNEGACLGYMMNLDFQTRGNFPNM